MVMVKPSPHLELLEEYKPLRPLEHLATDLGLPRRRLIKLDGNENPFGPAPEVTRALQELTNLERYPDPLATSLCQKIARIEGLSENNVLVTAGADELIDLIIRAYVDRNEAVLTLSPTFGMYKFLARVHGVNVIELPLKLQLQNHVAQYHVDERALLDNATHCKVLFITRPNNPDGSWVNDKIVEQLLELSILVAIDEAYIEFASSAKTIAPLVTKHDNLLILRTFSKAHALAGLRIGYGIMPPHVKNTLVKIKQPYNVNVAGLKAAEASLESSHVQQHVKIIKEIREFTFQRLLALREHAETTYWIHRSDGPFLLIRFDKEKEAVKLRDFLRSRGIVLRYYSSPSSLTSCLRVSIGRVEEMTAFLEAFEKGVAKLETNGKS